MSTDNSINTQQINLNPFDFSEQENNSFKTTSLVETFQPNTSRLGENNFAGLYFKSKLLNSGGNSSATAVQNNLTANLNAVKTIQNVNEPRAYPKTLNFEESKSISYIAYDGQKGEVYQFADGSTWRVDRAEKNNLTGFKAVEMRKVIKNGDAYVDDPNDNRVVIGFAGSDSPVDYLEDLQQAEGKVPAQYMEAAAFTSEVQQDAAKNCENVNLTGHSLGGGLATYVSIQTGLPATGINSAPLSNGKIPDGVNYDDQITQYYGKGEILTDLDNANPFDFRPGKHIEVDTAIDEDKFINSLPLWQRLLPNVESSDRLAISLTNHLLKNTAPEVAVPQKVVQ